MNRRFSFGTSSLFLAHTPDAPDTRGGFAAESRVTIAGPCARGFTLIELAIALVVASVLLGIAAPSMQRIIQEQRLGSQANDVLADLNFARSEAIKRAASVIVCKTANAMVSSPTCDTTTSDRWTSGRIIFVDSNGNGALDSGEPILRIRQALNGNGNKLLGDSNASGTANAITFTYTGMTNWLSSNTSTASDYQLILCDARGSGSGRAIVINATGRTRVTNPGTDMNGTMSSTECPTP